MPLRDHFRSPVNDTHSWDELHGQWPGEMVRHLRTILPAGFRAAPQVHLGSSFEVDIGTFDLGSHDQDAGIDARDGGTATLTASAPTYTLEAELTDQDEYEVRIYDTEHGRTLFAAIEIVSPGNKDRPESRDIFTGKAAALLNQGVCVSVVDVVSVRQANLYAELVAMYGGADPQLADPPTLYAATVRTRRIPRRHRPRLEAWFLPMTVGHHLPTIPIWLSETLRIDLPLETSYEETCRVLDIG
jgi:hypothetical protein